MKPATLLSLVVLLIALERHALSQVEWERTFGGTNGEVATAVQPTTDGGYILVGEENSFGPLNAWYVIKLDAAGDLDANWPENPKSLFRSEGGGFATGVQETSEGGFVIAGAGHEPLSIVVTKLDGRGNLDTAWSENPKVYDRGIAWCLQPTSDGGFIVAGETRPENASRDVYLLKLDATGNPDPVWPVNPKTFGGQENDRAYCARQTSDGGYIVAGRASSFGARSDVYLIKLDPAGNLDPAWTENPKTFGGERGDRARDVRQTSDGGYLVAGDTHSLGAGSSDVYLIRLDATGNLDPSWAQNPWTFGGADGDSASSIVLTLDGGFVVAGGTNSVGAGIEGSQDLLLLKLDATGAIDRAWPDNPQVFGGVGSDFAQSVQQTSDGGYIVAGSTSSFGAGSSDAYVMKLGPSLRFQRGDGNGDGRTNIGDAVHSLQLLFVGAAPKMDCDRALDYNADLTLDVADALFLLLHLFRRESSPMEPFAECGLDTHPSPLTCVSFPACE